MNIDLDIEMLEKRIENAEIEVPIMLKNMVEKKFKRKSQAYIEELVDCIKSRMIETYRQDLFVTIYELKGLKIKFMFGDI